MLTVEEIRKLCVDSGVLELCSPVLDNPKFSVCPLNLEEGSHYSYVGGLLQYTGELLSSGTLLCSLYRNYNQKRIDPREYLVSVMWCNISKCLQYDCVDTEKHVWIETSPSSLLDVSYRSAMEFQKYMETLQESDGEVNISIDRVIHNILSPATRSTSTPESVLLLAAMSLSQQLYST